MGEWCRKRFTRSDKELCRQSDNEVDDLCTAAFACGSEEIPETAGTTIIVSANAASSIIAKDVLHMS
jgi:hypothetical protein